MPSNLFRICYEAYSLRAFNHTTKSSHNFEVMAKSFIVGYQRPRDSQNRHIPFPKIMKTILKSFFTLRKRALGKDHRWSTSVQFFFWKATIWSFLKGNSSWKFAKMYLQTPIWSGVVRVYFAINRPPKPFSFKMMIFVRVSSQLKKIMIIFCALLIYNKNKTGFR